MEARSGLPLEADVGEPISPSDFEQGEIGPDLFRKACEFGLEGRCRSAATGVASTITINARYFAPSRENDRQRIASAIQYFLAMRRGKYSHVSGTTR